MDHNKFEPAHHQILKDLNNKAAERKAKKRENSLLAFVMTATARDNEKNILINKLRKEACNHLKAVRLLQIENEIKDNLLKLKDEELESLKSENEKLQIALKNDHVSEAASTVNNILVASPKRELVISDSPVLKSNNDPPVESPKPSGRKRQTCPAEKGNKFIRLQPAEKKEAEVVEMCEDCHFFQYISKRQELCKQLFDIFIVKSLGYLPNSKALDSALKSFLKECKTLFNALVIESFKKRRNAITF